MTTQPTNWAAYDDFGEILGAGYNEPPAPGAHGLLVEDDFADGSWAWAWFATPEDRLGWIVRIKQIEPDPEPLSDEDVRELEKIGAGPTTSAGLVINGGDVSWMGSFEDLLQGKDEGARRWRARFWDGLEEEDVDDSIPSDHETPIPPEAREDFLSALYPM